MNGSRPFASLGPSLLARKGGAKPAMRPQQGALAGIGSPQAAQALAEELEDLGWNDMGEEGEHRRHSEILPLTPPPANADADARSRADDAEAHAELSPMHKAEPEIRRQQRAIEETMAKAVSDSGQRKSQTAVKRRSALEQGRRAAFTLRLDAQRHLKLRLASTIKNCSAQQLVTQALDRLLAEIPELDSLTAQLKRDGN